MKIAFFSESTADESALKILIEGLLQDDIEEINIPNKLRYRSSSHLDKDLRSVIAGVYYNSDAEALVVVSDSDDTPVHVAKHDEQENEHCRLCKIRNAIEKVISALNEMSGRKMLKVAIGVPTPAIEAWYLFGNNPHVSEAIWIRKQDGENIDFDRKRLKKLVYGSIRYSAEFGTKRAIEEATRIVENELLEGLQRNFPMGFGSLVNETKEWKA